MRDKRFRSVTGPWLTGRDPHAVSTYSAASTFFVSTAKERLLRRKVSLRQPQPVLVCDAIIKQSRSLKQSLPRAGSGAAGEEA